MSDSRQPAVKRRRVLALRRAHVLQKFDLRTWNMTTITRVKLIFAGIGLAVFAVGVRLDDARWRYAGIAFVAIAWTLRFVRPRQSDPTSTSAPNERSQSGSAH